MMAARIEDRPPTNIESLRLPPHSVEAEQAVLGAVMLDARTWPQVRVLLGEADFYRASHRAIWRAIGRLLEAGAPADMLAVKESLAGTNELDHAGGLGYLHELATRTGSTANARHYAEIVASHARRRELARIGNELQDAAYAPGADVPALHATATNDLAALHGRIAARAVPALDLVALAEAEPQPPQSIMTGMFAGHAVGVFGHGGAGKSQIELARAVCIASGRDFWGLDVARRRVMVLECEDRAPVPHWRLSRICRHLGIDLGGLRGWLHVVDMVGRDAVLYDPHAGRPLTPVYSELARWIEGCGAEVLLVDGISDTYAGDENNRGQVKRYVNALLGLVPPDRGAVTLIGHVDKATVRKTGRETEGYSGSTQWNNAVRSRWYLYPEMQGDAGEAPERTGKLIFELQKENYSKDLTLIEFTWDDVAHVFVGRTPSALAFDRRHQERQDEVGILAALQSCAAKGITVPAASTGQRTAFHVLSAADVFPDALRGDKRRFWRRVEGLRQLGQVAEREHRRASDRHPIRVLVATAAGNTRGSCE